MQKTQQRMTRKERPHNWVKGIAGLSTKIFKGAALPVFRRHIELPNPLENSSLATAEDD